MAPMTPTRRTVPAESETRSLDHEPEALPDTWEPPKRLVRALRPWIDLSEVGALGFYRWLETMLTVLPRPGTEVHSHADAETRVRELSRTVAGVSAEAARAHFQAAQYFRESQVLAIRVMGLEAMLRTQGVPGSEHSKEVEASLRRYLPK